MKRIQIGGHRGGKIKGYALVDDKDFEELNKYKWLMRRNGKLMYAISTKYKEKAIHMHRFILNLKESEYADHINHNGLDNRKTNLRICTHGENMRNKRISINNKSGYKGVYMATDKNKWRCQISLNKKQIHIGYFFTKEDCARAYNEAAKKYFGEFAYLNKINE